MRLHGEKTGCPGFLLVPAGLQVASVKLDQLDLGQRPAVRDTHLCALMSSSLPPFKTVPTPHEEARFCSRSSCGQQLCHLSLKFLSGGQAAFHEVPKPLTSPG